MINKVAILLAAAVLSTACGQSGDLVRPQNIHQISAYER